MGDINQTDALPEDKSLIMSWFDSTWLGTKKAEIMSWFDSTWKSQLVADEMSKTFYVDNTGDDSNIGDYDNPLRTFAEAVGRTPRQGRVYIYVKSNLNDASAADATDKTILVDIADNANVVFEWTLDSVGKYWIKAFSNPKYIKFTLRDGATMKIDPCPDPSNIHYAFFGIVFASSSLPCNVALVVRNHINQDFLVLRDKACLVIRSNEIEAIALTIEAYYDGDMRVDTGSYLLAGRAVGSYDVFLSGVGVKDENGNTRTPESCVQYKAYDADGNCKNLLSYHQTL